MIKDFPWGKYKSLFPKWYIDSIEGKRNLPKKQEGKRLIYIRVSRTSRLEVHIRGVKYIKSIKISKEGKMEIRKGKGKYVDGIGICRWIKRKVPRIEELLYNGWIWTDIVEENDKVLVLDLGDFSLDREIRFDRKFPRGGRIVLARYEWNRPLHDFLPFERGFVVPFGDRLFVIPNQNGPIIGNVPVRDFEWDFPGFDVFDDFSCAVSAWCSWPFQLRLLRCWSV